MKLRPNRCPKCGEPARFMRALMTCLVPLVWDCEDCTPEFGDIRRVGKQPTIESSIRLECGGGHTWSAEEIA